MSFNIPVTQFYSDWRMMLKLYFFTQKVEILPKEQKIILFGKQ